MYVSKKLMLALSSNTPDSGYIATTEGLEPVYEEEDIESVYSKAGIAYITDLHLDVMVRNRYGENGDPGKIGAFLEHIAKQLGREFDDLNCRLLLIGGDTAASLELAEKFYKDLTKAIDPWKIVVISGNHELWDRQDPDHVNEQAIADTVRELKRHSKECGYAFLHNSLMAIKNIGRCVACEEDLMNASDEDIRRFCTDSKYTILAGIGFSGKDRNFNADNNIYRTSVDRECEIEQSERFDRLYRRIESALSDDELIVLTHMPMNCWSDGEYNRNWVHISGHTHRNVMKVDESCTVLSNNQIGYRCGNPHLKSYRFCPPVNIFRYLDDGIHKIEREEYLEFNRYLNKDINYNGNGRIILVKRSGMYMFLTYNDKNKLMLLAGGMRKRLKEQDLNYYYDRMEEYGRRLNDTVMRYFDMMERIGSDVRRIGGSGRVHGCIVDVTFLNHLYVNPFDGTVTPYHAQDMVDKHLYRNLSSMLYSECPELYDNYVKLLASGSGNITSLSTQVEPIDEKTQPYTSTDIYSYSRRMCRYQFFKNHSVIREWDEKIFDSDSSDSLIMAQFLKEGE